MVSNSINTLTSCRRSHWVPININGGIDEKPDDLELTVLEIVRRISGSHFWRILLNDCGETTENETKNTSA